MPSCPLAWIRTLSAVALLSALPGLASPQTPTPSPPASSTAPASVEAEGTAEAPTDVQPAKQGPVEPSDIEELKRQIDVLAVEIEKLRSGDDQPVDLPDARRQSLGLAPSAAATYRKRQGVSLAGYGEMLYENFDEQNESGTASPRGSQLDFLRAILYAGYRFSDKFVFNSELELEHTSEISLEFAYLDYLVRPEATLRGGLVLVPLGLVNEFHEPNVFLGARRPESETRIIPSTWRENGAGALGSVGPVSYRAFAVNGMNATGFSADGLRGGRQKGGRARASDLGFAGRVDVSPTPGIMVGTALYTGNSAQDQYTVDGRLLDVRTTLVEAHGQARLRGLDVRGLFVRATVGEAGALNAARGLPASAGVAEVMTGGYMQAGYNVLSQVAREAAVTPFYRFERVDTQHRMPAGYEADPARDVTYHTIGLEVSPIHNIVVKTDYMVVRNEAGTGRNQFNIALGYAF